MGRVRNPLSFPHLAHIKLTKKELYTEVCLSGALYWLASEIQPSVPCLKARPTYSPFAYCKIMLNIAQMRSKNTPIMMASLSHCTAYLTGSLIISIYCISDSSFIHTHPSFTSWFFMSLSVCYLLTFLQPIHTRTHTRTHTHIHTGGLCYQGLFSWYFDDYLVYWQRCIGVYLGLPKQRQGWHKYISAKKESGFMGGWGWGGLWNDNLKLH